MPILFETDKLMLKHEFEAIFLIEKSTNKIFLEEFFYGDPQCGLIDINSNWAIVGGVYLTIWTREENKIFRHTKLMWIHSLRLKDSDTVEILIDPYTDNSAIWEINTSTFQIHKVKEFDSYKGKEYTENIIW